MYDKELVLDILYQIQEASCKVIQRFERIKRVTDFTDSPEGMEKPDSICMLLIEIGESLKSIDKITKNNLLGQYSEVDWKGVKGLRDIITHHYFDIDAEVIFLVCEKHIPVLSCTVEKMIADMV
ncbi:MAG: DUF86 domain-containing protein [Chlorobiaceae bacterium]|jgi:uncharacterized protein with HEPN domain|nr:DUF86 domain-containing protein [Chlorobiaceae bacterium]